MQTGAATVENSMEVPQKVNNGTALWPRVSTLGYLSEEIQNTTLERYTHPSVHYSIISNSQLWEATQVSTDKQLDKEDVEHTCDGILLSHKKEWNLAICDNMEGP